ncbi:MAG TPA: hypothetical protein VNL71_09910 [Chloroflexota bacterium]|nr:hypothetical protein [Chloroflexota bacterium]
MIARPASAIGRAVAAGPRTTERRALPVAEGRPISAGSRTTKGWSISTGPRAAEGRAFAVAPAAIEGGPITLWPSILMLALSLGSASAILTRAAKRGPLAG